MAGKSFRLYDILVAFVSLVSYLVDVGTDILLIVLFFLEGHTVWGATSLTFVAAATLMIQIFSFRWHVSDGTLTCRTFLVHLFFMAPVQRYVNVVKLGIQAKRSKDTKDTEAAFREMNDISILRLFESFMESAPQLILQLYIILTTGSVNWVIGVSTSLSLTSLGWAVAAYTDALRLACRENYNRKWTGFFAQTCWQIGMVASRVMAVVIFATVFQAWTFLAMGIHWIFMWLWVIFQQVGFGQTQIEKQLFNFIAGFMYIFCFLNLKDGRSRWRMLLYYMVMIGENSLLVLLWFLHKPADTPIWYNVVTLGVVYGGFVIGGCCLMGYYRCCHPSGPVPVSPKSKTPSSPREKVEKGLEQETAFDASGSSSASRVALWLNASVDLSKDEAVDTDMVGKGTVTAGSSKVPSSQNNRMVPATEDRVDKITDGKKKLTNQFRNSDIFGDTYSYLSGGSRRQLICSASESSTIDRKGLTTRETSFDDGLSFITDSTNIPFSKIPSESELNRDLIGSCGTIPATENREDRIQVSGRHKEQLPSNSRHTNMADSYSYLNRISRQNLVPSLSEASNLDPSTLIEERSYIGSKANTYRTPAHLLRKFAITGVSDEQPVPHSKLSVSESNSSPLSNSYLGQSGINDEIHPIKLSPLDAVKLWEESQDRLEMTGLSGSYWQEKTRSTDWSASRHNELSGDCDSGIKWLADSLALDLDTCRSEKSPQEQHSGLLQNRSEKDLSSTSSVYESSQTREKTSVSSQLSSSVGGPKSPDYSVNTNSGDSGCRLSDISEEKMSLSAFPESGDQKNKNNFDDSQVTANNSVGFSDTQSHLVFPTTSNILDYTEMAGVQNWSCTQPALCDLSVTSSGVYGDPDDVSLQTSHNLSTSPPKSFTRFSGKSKSTDCLLEDPYRHQQSASCEYEPMKKIGSSGIRSVSSNCLVEPGAVDKYLRDENLMLRKHRAKSLSKMNVREDYYTAENISQSVTSLQDNKNPPKTRKSRESSLLRNGSINQELPFKNQPVKYPTDHSHSSLNYGESDPSNPSTLSRWSFKDLFRDNIPDTPWRQKFLDRDSIPHASLLSVYAELSEAESLRYRSPGRTTQTMPRTPLKVTALENSPYRLGRSVDLFDGDTWRASIRDRDPEMRRHQSQVSNIPRRLYSRGPDESSDDLFCLETFTDSPYKIRIDDDVHYSKKSSNSNTSRENTGHVLRNQIISDTKAGNNVLTKEQGQRQRANVSQRQGPNVAHTKRRMSSPPRTRRSSHVKVQDKENSHGFRQRSRSSPGLERKALETVKNFMESFQKEADWSMEAAQQSSSSVSKSMASKDRLRRLADEWKSSSSLSKHSSDMGIKQDYSRQPYGSGSVSLHLSRERKSKSTGNVGETNRNKSRGEEHRQMDRYGERRRSVEAPQKPPRVGSQHRGRGEQGLKESINKTVPISLGSVSIPSNVWPKYIDSAPSEEGSLKRALDHPCYMYSDSESEEETPTSRRTTSGQGSRSHNGTQQKSDMSVNLQLKNMSNVSINSRLSDESKSCNSTIQSSSRKPFRSLENTPQLSPICREDVSLHRAQIEQGNVLKPVMSTPKLPVGNYSSDRSLALFSPAIQDYV